MNNTFSPDQVEQHLLQQRVRQVQTREKIQDDALNKLMQNDGLKLISMKMDNPSPMRG
jgi:predicted negative regulator of RcsB-dependent stress response